MSAAITRKPSNQAAPATTLRDILGGDDDAQVVTIGFTSKSEQGEVGQGSQPNTLVLGPGSIQADGSIIYPEVAAVAYSPRVHDFQVWPGDVLVRARGVRGTAGPVAAYVDRAQLDRAVRKRGFQAAVFNNTIYRIRLQDGHNAAPGLDPMFLSLLINSDASQRFFASRLQRSSVSGISRKDLLDLPLHLPSLEQQAALGRLHQLQVEHASVTGEIARRYSDLLQASLNRFSN
jgi:hypothetical protein